MTAFGTFETSRDVRYLVAIAGKAEVGLRGRQVRV
jgi:hypothetical protein